MKRNVPIAIAASWTAGMLAASGAGVIISNVGVGVGDTLYANHDNSLMNRGVVSIGYFAADIRDEDIDTIPELLAQLRAGRYTNLTQAAPGTYSPSLGGAFAGYAEQSDFTNLGLITAANPLVDKEGKPLYDANVSPPVGRTIYSIVTSADSLDLVSGRSQFALLKISRFREDLPVENQYSSNPPGAVSTLIGIYGTFTGDAGAGFGDYRTLMMDLTPIPTYEITSCASTFEGGTLTGTGVYDEESQVTVAAVPDAGYRFVDWENDFAGMGNPVNLTLQPPLPTRLTFCPKFERDLSDADADGLTAYEEAQLGTDPGRWDSDGDGLSDGFEVGLGQFSIVSGRLTWEQARADAVSRGGYLATFATQAEWDALVRTVSEAAFYDIDGLWIGATDRLVEGSWSWVTGEPFSFSNWAPGEPDNFNDADFAAVAGELGGWPGKWYDYRAAVSRDGYILEIGFKSNPLNPDTDADGLQDGEEHLYGTNPEVVDTDGDCLSDQAEVRWTQTHPLVIDSDGDGVPDGDEDNDGDGLANCAEVRVYGTHPGLRDSNADGLHDGLAVQMGLKPMDDHKAAVAMIGATRGNLQLLSVPDLAAQRPGSVPLVPVEGVLEVALGVQRSKDLNGWSKAGQATGRLPLGAKPDPNAFYRYVPTQDSK